MELSWLPKPSQLVSYSHMHSVNKELLQTKLHSQNLLVAVGLNTPPRPSNATPHYAGFPGSLHYQYTPFGHKELANVVCI